MDIRFIKGNIYGYFFLVTLLKFEIIIVIIGNQISMDHNALFKTIEPVINVGINNNIDKNFDVLSIGLGEKDLFL